MSNELERIKISIQNQISFDNVTPQFEEKQNTIKMYLKGLRLRNPILTASIGQSIISNVSKKIPKERKSELYSLWKEGVSGERKEEFEKRLRENIVDAILKQVKDKLNSKDLPTPISPTSVAQSEIPNYYITEEHYSLHTKEQLFVKLIETVCGRCGEHTYGLWAPGEIRGILKTYVPDFNNVNIVAIAEVGWINKQEIGPFEYLFYLLDKVLQEMYRRNQIPDYHVELFVAEGIGPGKKSFSYYIIPNLTEVFDKLYYGDDKYSGGRSKLKSLIFSFLVENWKVESNLRQNNSERAHAQINRLLYYLFYHKKLEMDSIIFLEDLKIKLGDSTRILFLDEVLSWM
jgi:hypothetical protein